jgi:non-specific serine/threonine protein kinase/serine/threonine-protein kinase
MTPEHWRRVKDLFDAALARDPAARAGFVAVAAAGDPALADEVLRLVALDEKASGFLSAPADAPAVAVAAGRRIGRYRVLGEMGRGGMGVVLRAVRDDDQYQKQVAIKLLRGGLGPDFVVERFKAERQILATLEHPNIAHLIDGGATEEGWPWLAMECVEGRPIDEFCVRRGLSIRGRLELFRTVCSAVQYAHQRLVVHRDLKPSNILVTEDGIPKLLDFGIAKLLGAEPGSTLTKFPLMTPEYASPEQVAGAPITTAADVYSLGMLLYELLAGRRAYELAAWSPQEIVRVVCEVEPQPPSAVAPQEVSRRLAGDLDTIVLKTLRKEPARRYASVQELSEDIRRHLAGLPVLARGDTLGYRVSRFVARHRAGVAAAALLLISLLGGMAMTLRQARIAEANRAQSERRFADVRKLANWVLFDMHDAIAKLPGSTPASKQLVEKAVDYLDGLAGEAAGDQALQGEIARGYERLSRIQGQPGWANLGDVAAAIASQRKAIALRERLVAAAPADAGARALLAKSHAALGYLLERPEAWNELEKTKSILGAVPASADSSVDVLETWLSYFNARGALEADAYDLTALRETRRQELDVMEKLYAMNPAVYQRSLAVVYKQYGSVLQELKELAPARALYEKALALDRKAAEAEPLDPLRKMDLSFSYGSIGSLLREEGDLAGASAAHQSALELRKAVLAADSMNEFALKSAIWAHKSLAGVLAARGDLDGAIGHEREVLRLRQAWEKDHPSRRGASAWEASFHSSVADHRASLAARPVLTAALRRKQWRRARDDYSRALAIWLELGKRAPLKGGPDRDEEGAEGDYTENPERLRRAIANCDETLAKLGHH